MPFDKLAAAAGVMLCVGLVASPAEAGTYIDAGAYGAALTNTPAVRARTLAPRLVVYQDDLASWGGAAGSLPMAVAGAGRASDGGSRAASRGHPLLEADGVGPGSYDPHLLETLYGRVFLARMDAGPPDWLREGARLAGAGGFVPGGATLASGEAGYHPGGVVLTLVSAPAAAAVVAVPEPASIALFGAGLLGLVALRRRSLGPAADEGPSPR